MELQNINSIERDYIFKKINNGFIINNYYVKSIEEFISEDLLKKVDKIADDIKFNNIKLSFKLTHGEQ